MYIILYVGKTKYDFKFDNEFVHVRVISMINKFLMVKSHFMIIEQYNNFTILFLIF